jgi:phage terminase large subunit
MIQSVRFDGGYEKFVGRFAKYMENRKRYLIFYGGAGSGKSHAAASKILFRLLTEDDAQHRILVMRKTFPALRKSCFALLRDKIRQWDINPLFDINKSTLTITCLKNGNQIIAGNMDDPEKLKSIERITSIWIEEATEQSLDDFTHIDLRLRGEMDCYKQIIMTFNPIDMYHWIKGRFIDQPDSDCTVDHSTARTNPWIDEPYLKVLARLKEQDEDLYQIYALGRWGRLRDLIYSRWNVEIDWPENFDETIYGMDFGYNNETAILQVNYLDNQIFEREILYERFITNTELIQRMESILQNKDVPIYADCAEPNRIAELRKAGWNVIPADKSVKDGIDACKSVSIHIHPDSENDIKEISSYKWQKKNEQVQEIPVKFRDHLQDCRRYAHYTHTKNRVDDFYGYINSRVR